MIMVFSKHLYMVILSYILLIIAVVTILYSATTILSAVFQPIK